DDLPENTFMWSGGCALEDRLFAAIELATYIEKTWDGKSPINLIGHSHGGNVAIEAANILGQKGLTIDTLITIQTPVLKEHQLTEGNVKIHMNFYGALDPVQKLGGHGLTSPLLPTANQYKDGDWGLAGRTFANAGNYQTTRLSIHTQYYNDVKFWRINLARHINQIPYLKPYLNMK
ncbi:MAG: thioesterase domain-containing protein, partial [Kiritimatiellae bacterium]|nr:thioesterase domain-containing protein [Kiritimatiellia bacterium]